MPPDLIGVDLSRQTADQAAAKSWGCVQCHQNVGDMHQKTTVRLGCVDCHGGCATANTKEAAHVLPRFADDWPASGNPVRSATRC